MQEINVAASAPIWLTNGYGDAGGMNADAAFDLLEFITNLADVQGACSVNNGVLWIEGGISINLQELLEKATTKLAVP